MTYPFRYLSEIASPQKLSFTHKLIEKLLNIEGGTTLDEQIMKMKSQFYQLIEELVKAEGRFSISRLEYEKKQVRFIENTFFTEPKLDQIFSTENLQFKEVPYESLKERLEKEDLYEFVKLIEEAIKIINIDVRFCKLRTDFLVLKWQEISQELFDRIRTFEHRGMKKASSNLRVRVLPILSELKSNLKLDLIEGVISRVEISERIAEFVNEVREDIFGELTEEQIFMLEDLNPNLTSRELIEYISNEKSREDLIYLLETDKITIKLDKSIDNLI